MRRASYIIALWVLAHFAATASAQRPPTPEPHSTVVTTHLDITDSYDGLISLREAINYATLNQTISFNLPAGSPTTITLQSDLPPIGPNTVNRINGSNHGPDGGIVCINGDRRCRLFALSNIQQITFDSLRFLNGKARSGPGGAISAARSKVTINHCQFDSNYAQTQGGAISIIRENYAMAVQSSLTLNHCLFSNNTAGRGGAIYGCFNAQSQTIHIDSCTFINNVSTNSTSNSNEGGAICAELLKCIINQCQFFKNRAESENNNTVSRGGALCILSYSLELSNCTFDSNSVSAGTDSLASAGTIYLANTTTSIYNCSFSNSSASGIGGAISFRSTSSLRGLSIGHSSFSNNSAYQGGAVSCSASSRCNIDHCTFSSNQANIASALYLNNPSLPTLISNCTFANNSSPITTNGAAIMSPMGEIGLYNNLFDHNTNAIGLYDVDIER